MDWKDALVTAERTLFAFALALVATRLMNKRILATLTYFDFIIGVTVGSLVGHISDDFEKPLLAVAIPVAMVTALGIVTAWLAMRWQRLRNTLQGEPTVLIQNGKILEDNIRRLRFNMSLLNSQLRTSGVFDVSHVEFAVLEPGGGLSVQLKSQYRPVTPHDLKLSTHYEGLSTELIMDGKVIGKNLQENGLTEEWLQDRLRERGVGVVADVYYAALNTKGEFCLDLYRDRLPHAFAVEGRSSQPPPASTKH